MSKLMRVCEIYSLEFGLDFNVAKCCLVPFSSHNNNLNVKLKLNNVEIPVSDSYKHLGNKIFNRNSMFRVDDIITDMKIRSNVLINEFSKLDSESKKVLFKSQCLGLYGCELLDLEHRSIDTLCVAWRKCSRKVLGVPYRTHCDIVPALLNCNSILTLIEERTLNFVVRGLKHSNPVIKFVFNNAILNNHGYILRNMNIILNKHKISYLDIFNTKKFKLSDDNFPDLWKIDFINEILEINDAYDVDGFTMEELTYFLFFCVVTNLTSTMDQELDIEKNITSEFISDIW